MILTKNNNEVERGNTGTEHNFKIKTTAKAFDILSSGIYTMPIHAIIRELSSNAFDAHKDANTTRPFEIQLPSSFEPFLVIKDYGTGLSEESVLNLYTTYFESTKTESNDFIGALGIGSKSPFSYTDIFSVESRFNNIVSHYSIFLNEIGLPTVSKIGVFNTEEDNGLTIKIPVKKEDIFKFKTATQQTLQFFDEKPIIINDSDFKFANLIPVLEGERWLIVEPVYGFNNIIALQRQIPYKVSLEKLQNRIPDYLHEIIRTNIIILEFENGELDFSSSREEIRYDNNTLNKIIQRIEKMGNELTNNIIEKSKEYEKLPIYDCFDELHKLIYNRKFYNVLVNCKYLNKNSKLYNFVNNSAQVQIPYLPEEFKYSKKTLESEG